MIRGRICHPNKPDTFNQLWTVEEQVGSKCVRYCALFYQGGIIQRVNKQMCAETLDNTSVESIFKGVTTFRFFHNMISHLEKREIYY